jgi:hypothetical protein
LEKRNGFILETLTQAYPATLNKEELAARAGYEANGGGFNNALGRLRTLELVQGRAVNSGRVTTCSTPSWREGFGEQRAGQKNFSLADFWWYRIHGGLAGKISCRTRDEL